MENIDVFGLKVSNFSMPDLDQLFFNSISNKGNSILYGYSFGFIPLLKKYTDLYHVTNSFDLLVIDGTQFKWFCSFFGFKIKTVISIPDLTNYALDYANNKGLKVLLFGAKKYINNRATDKLSKKFPNIKFLKGIDGYFERDDENDIVNDINKQSPDILLIGISTPVKERFAYKYKYQLNTGLIIPCGGMIDVYAGLTRQTPKMIKNLGLATPFRVLQEPKRLLLLNLWIIYETLFKLFPIVFYNRFILKHSDFNSMNMYLKNKQ